MLFLVCDMPLPLPDMANQVVSSIVKRHCRLSSSSGARYEELGRTTDGSCIFARWALNNVATFGTPSCVPTLDVLRNDPGYMGRMAQATRLGNMQPIQAFQQSGNDLQVPLLGPDAPRAACFVMTKFLLLL